MRWKEQYHRSPVSSPRKGPVTQSFDVTHRYTNISQEEHAV